MPCLSGRVLNSTADYIMSLILSYTLGKKRKICNTPSAFLLRQKDSSLREGAKLTILKFENKLLPPSLREVSAKPTEGAK